MSGSLKYTIPYYNCSFSLVGKKDEPLNLSSYQRIAMVEKVDGLQEVLEDKYPKWEIVTYDTPKDCLTAVENGNADCAMVSSIKLSADRNLLGMNLVVVDGSTAVSPVYIGVSESANPLLAQVLSKSIAKAGEGAMDEAVYATLLSGKENKDFSYFIQTYPLYFAFGVIAVSLLGVGILFMRYDARHQKLQNLILQKKNEELKAAIAMQTLLRRKAQTDALTGLKNKSTTEELCRACLEHAQGDICALFILDLDDFKHINDERGHQAGDVVPGVFQLRIVGKQGVEQEQADDGPEGEAQLVQQEEVDHHQGDGAPEFELVVVFREEAAGLDKKALARLDPGPPLQGDQQDAQNHQNSNGDDGENPVLG